MINNFIDNYANLWFKDYKKYGMVWWKAKKAEEIKKRGRHFVDNVIKSMKQKGRK